MDEGNDVPPKTGNVRNSKKKLIKIAAIGAAVVILFAGLVAIPVVSPTVGAQVADALRTVLGPQPVADLESTSFQIQDWVNRIRYRTTGAQPALSFSDTPLTPGPTHAPVATRAPHINPTSTPTPILQVAQATANLPTPEPPAPTAAPLPDIANDAPAIESGWQPFGAIANGRSVMARGSVHPDGTRPYAQAALVRIDLSLVDVHFVLGTLEPVTAKGLQPISRTGDIPISDQSTDRLIAAFNGGFKAVHGEYGVVVSGTTVITPESGIATLAIYHDGSVALGDWGHEITTSNTLVDIRQNCPLLIDYGQITSSVNDSDRKEWGYTVKNLDTTWRSGIGLTQDGKYLIYAAGPSLTVESLAHTLQMAGAYRAMQLDINGYYTRFAIYHSNPTPATAKGQHPVIAEKLLTQMTLPPDQYLTPYDRDFFYITLHSG
jgi:hypothetical protein